MSCKCQGCEVEYDIDFLVPDYVWEMIKPKDTAEGAGMLCGACITNRIEDVFKGVLGALHLVEQPLSWEQFCDHFFPGVDPVVLKQASKYFPIVSKTFPNIDAKIEAWQACAKVPTNLDAECIVKGCGNRPSEGKFTGVICSSCYEYIAEGKGYSSQARRNALALGALKHKEELAKMASELTSAVAKDTVKALREIDFKNALDKIKDKYPNIASVLKADVDIKGTWQASSQEKNVMPRRAQMDKMVKAELTIMSGVAEVECMGANPLLTEAIMLLGEAQSKVADYVDKFIRKESGDA